MAFGFVFLISSNASENWPLSFAHKCKLGAERTFKFVFQHCAKHNLPIKHNIRCVKPGAFGRQAPENTLVNLGFWILSLLSNAGRIVPLPIRTSALCTISCRSVPLLSPLETMFSGKQC